MNYHGEFAKIHRASFTLFGKDIDVSTRALQALLSAYRDQELFRAPISFSSDFECFLKVVASSPACADALIREGVPLHKWKAAKDVQPQEKRLDFRDYSRLFAEIFEAKWLTFGL